MNEQLIKRLKSFFWRLGVAVAVVVANFTAANIGIFDLSPAVQGFIILVLGEVTKYLNRYA